MTTLEERAAKLDELSGGVVAPGKWASISFVVPDQLQKVRESINDFFELINLILEIVNLGLEYAKAFLTGYVDPIDSLVAAILDELRALADDIAQLGIYIAHDAALFNDWPPDDLKGGFSSFERRMVARLTDKTDPTRPDVSSKMSVFSLFLYLSVDPTEVLRLYKAIMALINMFTGGKKKPLKFNLPVPVIREVFYGNDAASVFNPGTLGDAFLDFDGQPPNRFKVVWQVNPGANYPYNPFSKAAPEGFIVTVSTRPEGLGLVFSRPKKDEGKKEDKSGGEAQPHEYGLVVDQTGNQAMLHGGIAMLDFDDKELDYNNAVENNQWKDGSSAVYALPDAASSEVIPLAQLALKGTEDHELGKPFDGKGDEYYIQRAFEVDSKGIAFEWALGSFSLALGSKDMPQKVVITKESNGQMTVTPDGRASTYYVRVTALPKKTGADYKLDVLDDISNKNKPGMPWIIRQADVGGFSAAKPVAIAGDDTGTYLKMLRMAIKILVLVRPDLKHIDSLEETAAIKAKIKAGEVQRELVCLELSGMEPNLPLLRQMFPDGYDKWTRVHDSSSDGFMEVLDDLADVWATRIFNQLGSNPDLERMIVNGSKTLQEAKADQVLAPVTGSLKTVVDPDLTFQAWLEKGKKYPTFGLARNPWSLGLSDWAIEAARYSFAWPGGVPGHMIKMNTKQAGLADLLPERTTTKAETEAAMLKLPPSLRQMARQFVQEDGTLLIPHEHKVSLDILALSGAHHTSADHSPIFWSVVEDLSDMEQSLLVLKSISKSPLDPETFLGDITNHGSMEFAREILATYQNGVLLQEANFVLTAATAALTRPLADGEWIAIRAFDAFPELEHFFDALSDWLEAIAKALKDAVDSLVKYIEFVQAQIKRLQQLIRMINAFIQSLLNFQIVLPKLSALGLLSSGTDGVVADLMTATEKPYDSPLAYGAGIALVIPFAPTFLVDLFMLLIDSGEESGVVGAPDTVSREDVPPGSEAPADDGDPL